MTPLLEVRNVTRVFGGDLFSKNRTVALEDFSLVIEGDSPSITAMVGESGSGKTTLARILLGLIPPTRGEVLYEGKDLFNLSRREWHHFRKDVQFIFQDPFEVYNPFYKIDHVLTTPIAKFGLANSKAEAASLIQEALVAVGLRPEETLGRYPHQLSGGQRQRIMVARALLLSPRLIVADEPVSMIDASLRATVLESLRKLNRDFGISLLYITHDLTTAYQISENIIVLYQGSVAEVGAVDQVVKEPQHPYTQMLIGSIPLPDPDRSWGRDQAANGKATIGPGTHGCKFARRCPHAMPECYDNPPPLFQTDPNRAVACYLYRDAPSIAGYDLGKVLAGRAESQGRAL